jgi:hypothetical protein
MTQQYLTDNEDSERFAAWARLHFGQGYGFQKEDGTYISAVTRWAANAFKAGFDLAAAAQAAPVAAESSEVVRDAYTKGRNDGYTSGWNDGFDAAKRRHEVWQAAPVAADLWNETLVALASASGEIRGIHLTKAKDQTAEQLARLEMLRAECLVIGKRRAAILQTDK